MVYGSDQIGGPVKSVLQVVSQRGHNHHACCSHTGETSIIATVQGGWLGETEFYQQDLPISPASTSNLQEIFQQQQQPRNSILPPDKASMFLYIQQ